MSLPWRNVAERGLRVWRGEVEREREREREVREQGLLSGFVQGAATKEAEFKLCKLWHVIGRQLRGCGPQCVFSVVNTLTPPPPADAHPTQYILLCVNVLRTFLQFTLDSAVLCVNFNFGCVESASLENSLPDMVSPNCQKCGSDFSPFVSRVWI